MFTTKVKGIAQVALWLSITAVLVALSYIDVMPLFGAHQKSISLASVFMPLTGLCAGWVTPVITLVRSLFSFATTGSYWSFFLYVPSLFAAFAWRSRSFFFHVITPLTCMVLFIMHPQGAGAPLYTLYWLIPVGIWLSGSRLLLSRALASTFVAHAVGSVVWLNAYNIPSATWITLIPVVLFERLLFALALVSVYNTAHKVLSSLQSYTGGRILKGWNVH